MSTTSSAPTYRSGIQLGTIIGRGHFGEVLLGHDPVHGPVAVKLIRRDAGESAPEWAARKRDLLQEAQNLRKAAHDNVVRVHQLFHDDSDDTVIYVMEHCPDGCFGAAYKAGPMSIARVRDIATQAALGLNVLHARGMIHRDIKPSNLLMGQDGRVKLGDFGLVTDNLIAGYAGRAGYKDHFAPEVWSDRVTSVRTDVWALGMTLYRLLHGEKWYSEGPAPQSVVAAGGYAKRLRWLPHVPDKWRRIIRRMLADDPRDRFQSMQQVLTALSQLPVQPDWQCAVSSDVIEWAREVGQRREVVRWQRTPLRKQQWEAASEPLGVGRRRTLSQPSSLLTGKEAEAELQKFLSRKPR